MRNLPMLIAITLGPALPYVIAAFVAIGLLGFAAGAILI